MSLPRKNESGFVYNRIQEVEAVIAIMGIFQSKPGTVKDFCENHPNWNTYVLSVRNAREWAIIADVMFNDGIVHRGRMEVLQYFTDCVVEQLMKNDMEKDAMEIRGAYSSYKYACTPPGGLSLD